MSFKFLWDLWRKKTCKYSITQINWTFFGKKSSTTLGMFSKTTEGVRSSNILNYCSIGLPKLRNRKQYGILSKIIMYVCGLSPGKAPNREKVKPVIHTKCKNNDCNIFQGQVIIFTQKKPNIFTEGRCFFTCKKTLAVVWSTVLFT